MLVRKRYSGEEIVIIDKESGEEIVILVRLHENRQIGVGIEAPRPRFEIFRREVLARQQLVVGG
jgi:sRNA-binding carbon storage regulator CsrA